MTNLFIGSLSYNTDDAGLKAHFETVGEVKSAKVITDRESGRSKGFGFVEYNDADAAKKAIEQFDGKELDGRTITVNVARPKGEGGGGGRSFGASGGGGSFRRTSW